MPESKPPPPVPFQQPPPPWSRLHIWQIQWVRDLLVIAAVIGVVYIGYVIRVVTVPMLLAMLLAYLFEPLVRWLRVRGVCSRKTAAIGIIACSFFLLFVPLTLGLGFGIVQGAQAAGDVATNVARVQKSVAAPLDPDLRSAVPHGAWLKIRDYLAERPARKDRLDKEKDGPATTSPDAQPQTPPPDAGLISKFADKEEMRELGQRAIDWLSAHAGELSMSLGRRVAGSGADAARAAFSTATSVGTLLMQILLTTLFFYFFSTGWGRVLEFWESFIPEDKRDRTTRILSQMDRAIAGFVRGRITIALIAGCYFTFMYWLAGVPAPFLLGPLIGLLFIVPFMQILGVPVAMAMMWLNGVEGPIFAPELCAGSGGLWWILIAPLVIHISANFLDDYFLTPTIQGKHTDLAMPAIIFASIAGGALAGVYGLLLAIPVAACVRILMREVFWPRMQLWVRGEAKDFLPIGRE